MEEINNKNMEILTTQIKEIVTEVLTEKVSVIEKFITEVILQNITAMFMLEELLKDITEPEKKKKALEIYNQKKEQVLELLKNVNGINIQKYMTEIEKNNI